MNFVVGSLSAAVQLAVNNVTKERGIIYNSISQSDAINEATDFSKYTFHEALNPHLTSGAVGRYAFSKFGKKVAFLTADYAYGHEMVRGFLEAGKAFGIETLADIRHPLGTSDFSTLAAAHPGAEARHSLHQQFRPRSADRAEAGDRFRHQEDDARSSRRSCSPCQPDRGRTAGLRGRDRRHARTIGASRTSSPPPRRSTTASARCTTASCRPTTARSAMAACARC